MIMESTKGGLWEEEEDDDEEEIYYPSLRPAFVQILKKRKEERSILSAEKIGKEAMNFFIAKRLQYNSQNFGEDQIDEMISGQLLAHYILYYNEQRGYPSNREYIKEQYKGVVRSFKDRIREINEKWSKEFQFNIQDANYIYKEDSMIIEWPKRMHMFYKKRKEYYGEEPEGMNTWNRCENMMIRIAKGGIQVTDIDTLKELKKKLKSNLIMNRLNIEILTKFWYNAFDEAEEMLCDKRDTWEIEKKARYFKNGRVPELIDNNIKVWEEIERMNKEGIRKKKLWKSI
jgi:hypothetical protein